MHTDVSFVGVTLALGWMEGLERREVFCYHPLCCIYLSQICTLMPIAVHVTPSGVKFP